MYPNLHGYSQFGFGRRTCQGVPIVDQDLFLAMGGIAWALDLRKKKKMVKVKKRMKKTVVEKSSADGTETGAEVEVEEEIEEEVEVEVEVEVPVHWNDYTPLLIAKPMPFEFDATVRGEGKEAQLRQMWETGKGEDDEEEERHQMVEHVHKPTAGRDGGHGRRGDGDVLAPETDEDDHDGSDHGSETSAAAGSMTTDSVLSVVSSTESERDSVDVDADCCCASTSVRRLGEEEKQEKQKRRAFVSSEEDE